MGKAQFIIICLCLVIIAMFGILFTGKDDITKTEFDQTNLNLISSLGEENSKIKKENSFLNKNIEGLETTNEALDNIIEEQVTIISSIDNKDFNEEFIILPIYTADEYSYDIETNYYITIAKSAILLEKLDIIAMKLSKYSFNGLPIDVIGIENIDGKQIAVVKLEEAEENIGEIDPSQLKGKTWKVHYFQGSTGGYVTSTILVESFLQRDLDEKWIDGVRFLYDEQNVGTDHVSSIFEINYRK